MADKKIGRKWATRIFWIIFAFYLVVNIVLIILCLQPKPVKLWFSKPFMAGIIIGGLFVLIAMYFFYDNYLIPFMTAKTDSEEKDKQLNIYFLMATWFIPSLILQGFVILGFMITLHKSPLSGNIYIQPYKYGQIYKQFENLNKTEFSIGLIDKEESMKISERKEKALDIISIYFKDEIFKDGQKELNIYVIPFLIAIAFSFLGSLIYTLKDAVFRLHTKDLFPRTYVSYLIRFIFALSLSITIAYFIMDDWAINAAPILFLLIGFFPQRALQYIEEKAMAIFRLKSGKRSEVPLNLIQGMTEYKIYRFREIGVGDAQNLANVDLEYLHENLAYNYRLLCDFVSQAILLIHLETHFESLKTFGIRDILSFKSIINSDNYVRIAELLNIPNEKLLGILNLVETDHLQKRMESLSAYINRKTQEEIAPLKGK